MGYLLSFAVQRLKKTAVVEFFELIMAIIDTCQSVKTNLGDKYAELKAAANKVIKAAEITFKSNLTGPILTLDNRRDEILSAIERLVKAQVLSSDKETSDKALAVQNKMNSIDVPKYAQYFQESGAMDSLIGSLLGELEAETTAIGIKPLVLMLKETNDEMHRLILQRNEEMAQVPEGAFETARRKAEAVYREFVFYVNAYIALHVIRTNQRDESLEKFVNDFNRFLRKYSETQFKKPHSGEASLQPPTPEEEEEAGEQQEEEEEQQTPERTVTFLGPNNEVVAVQHYEVGQQIVPPEPPAGYIWNYHPNYMPDEDLVINCLEDE